MEYRNPKTRMERNEKGGMNKLLFCPFFLFFGEVNLDLVSEYSILR